MDSHFSKQDVVSLLRRNHINQLFCLSLIDYWTQNERDIKRSFSFPDSWRDRANDIVNNVCHDIENGKWICYHEIGKYVKWASERIERFAAEEEEEDENYEDFEESLHVLFLSELITQSIDYNCAPIPDELNSIKFNKEMAWMVRAELIKTRISLAYADKEPYARKFHNDIGFGKWADSTISSHWSNYKNTKDRWISKQNHLFKMDFVRRILGHRSGHLDPYNAENRAAYMTSVRNLFANGHVPPHLSIFESVDECIRWIEFMFNSFKDVSRTFAPPSQPPPQPRSALQNHGRLPRAARMKLVEQVHAPVIPRPQPLSFQQEYVPRPPVRYVPMIANAPPDLVERYKSIEALNTQVAKAHKQRVPTKDDCKQDVDLGDDADPSLTCVVCQSNKRNCIVVPCYHMCLCCGCARALEKTMECPICRGKAKKIKRVFE